MMYRVSSSLIVLLLTGFIGTSCVPAEDTNVPETAAPTETAAPAMRVVAQLDPTKGHDVDGQVTFTQENDRVQITGHLTGLKPGRHGFHIHENGDCSAPDASSAGEHFNPFGTKHGGPDDPEHHVGDLGNIEANGQGTAHIQMTVDHISLEPDAENSIVGKAVIVHVDADDLTSQPSGKAGDRVACGVLRSTPSSEY